MPPGRPGLLVMILALSAYPVPVDVVLEELWPDVEPDLARRRLRNVLARLKAACGELVTRRGDSLGLASGTTVDVTEFEAACARTLAAPYDQRPELARAALALASGPLLPEAAYGPRVSRRRDQVERSTVAMLGIVAEAAERAGAVDAAVDALTRRADLEPWDASICDRIAALLRSARRHRQAAPWARRAERIRAD